jgi:hypothetical protein
LGIIQLSSVTSYFNNKNSVFGKSYGGICWTGWVAIYTIIEKKKKKKIIYCIIIVYYFCYYYFIFIIKKTFYF